MKTIKIDLPVSAIVTGVARNNNFAIELSKFARIEWDKMPKEDKRKLFLEAVKGVIERYSLVELSDMIKALK